jgi:metal-sulfur cluster biosynthetic enzyme
MDTYTAATDVDRSEVDRRLDLVKDPCSLAAGTPLGLAEMGLVRGWDFDEHTGLLTVRLCVTSPACFLSGQMADAVREQLTAVAGVTTVEIVIDSDHRWSHDDATPAARERLSDNRATIVRLHGIRPQMWREDGRVHEVHP